MPRRRTKRGAERTPLRPDADVLICGASFAGLAVARQLAGSGAHVLMVDRYEIGERQTSACAAPTEWLQAMGVADSIRQTFGHLVFHTPHITARMRLPFTFSTFDYAELCSLLFGQSDATFETAKVEGRAPTNPGTPAAGSAGLPLASGSLAEDVPGGYLGAEDVPGGYLGADDLPVVISTDRGDISAPLVVDALGWRRLLAPPGYQPPDAPLSRGLEVHPGGASDELEIWIDRDYVPAGYGWSFPAHDEVRVGIGSFDPRFHVKQPTVRLAEDLERDAVRYQGNWIPHRLRPAAEDGVFFAGDSAGHCLPLSAEGIRTAFYFGIACGSELCEVIAGRATRDEALRRYASFSASHRWKFEAMLKTQQVVPRVPPRLLAVALRGMSSDAFVSWSFGHYFNIAPPEYARRHAPTVAGRAKLRAAA